jgi:hypothetical protein
MKMYIQWALVSSRQEIVIVMAKDLVMEESPTTTGTPTIPTFAIPILPHAPTARYT